MRKGLCEEGPVQGASISETQRVRWHVTLTPPPLPANPHRSSLLIPTWTKDMREAAVAGLMEWVTRSAIVQPAGAQWGADPPSSSAAPPPGRGGPDSLCMRAPRCCDHCLLPLAGRAPKLSSSLRKSGCTARLARGIGGADMGLHDMCDDMGKGM